MFPQMKDIIRAVANCGITSPNEKVKQNLVANGYDLPRNIEYLLAEAVLKMLEPPRAMRDGLAQEQLYLIATIPPVDAETYRKWRLYFSES